MIRTMAERLSTVAGVRAVVLGGSRARGTHRPDSDWDLGLYYRDADALDVHALASLAAEFTGRAVDIAAPGGWGPWVNGGAWLSVDGTAVDWILRDLDRVERVWADCRAGRFEVGTQAGHPLGFWSPAYAGEVAHCRVLADPAGELTALRARTRHYPDALREALAEAAWEAEFSVAAARKSVGAGDALHVSLCLSKAFGVLAQAMLAHERTWCLNEKGALAAAARLACAPPDFAQRVARALHGLDEEAVRAAESLVREVRGSLTR
ncbi:putative nucleotidyltransferase [Streptomyces candidus]|uniref:Putative nucleotidyltransferase n=2 Tax=Streptomyces candidus TaxID=67283 RepID=A0A7X0HBP8_9ACTN|nr:putative nucleotidyltransferase [Streptomyces candidus]